MRHVLWIPITPKNVSKTGLMGPYFGRRKQINCGFSQELKATLLSNHWLHDQKALQNYEESIKIFDQLEQKQYVEVIRNKIEEIHKNLGK